MKSNSDQKNAEVGLGARVNLYMAARKWDMAAAVASHLVKVEPQTAGWWISLAYALRRTESVEKAEANLLQAQAIHPKVAMIAFNLACYASVTGRMEVAKEHLRHAIDLDKDIRGLAIDDEDLRLGPVGHRSLKLAKAKESPIACHALEAMLIR
jgi:Flp pilus assembly protein TadD